MSVYIYTHTHVDVCVPNICALSPHNICSTKPPERAHLCTLAHRAGGGCACLRQCHHAPPWHRPPALPGRVLDLYGIGTCLADTAVPPNPASEAGFLPAGIISGWTFGDGIALVPTGRINAHPNLPGAPAALCSGPKSLGEGASGQQCCPFRPVASPTWLQGVPRPVLSTSVQDV